MNTEEYRCHSCGSTKPPKKKVYIVLKGQAGVVDFVSESRQIAFDRASHLLNCGGVVQLIERQLD